MGFEYDKVEDFLEEKGLCELNHERCITAMNNERYHNPLYTKPEEEMNYDFIDHSGENQFMSLPPSGKAPKLVGNAGDSSFNSI